MARFNIKNFMNKHESKHDNKNNLTFSPYTIVGNKNAAKKKVRYFNCNQYE